MKGAEDNRIVDGYVRAQPRRRGLHRRPGPGFNGVCGVWAPLIVVAALALMFGALWLPPSSVVDPAALSPTLARGPGAVGPVRVTAISASRVWVNRANTDVTVTLRKTVGYPVQAQVWWLLSRPADPQPWIDPVSASPHGFAELGVGERTVSIAFPRAAKVPPDGPYTLSAWVHVRSWETSRFVHSDGVGLATSVLVATVSPTLLVARSVAYPVSVVRITSNASFVRRGQISVTLANVASNVEPVQLWLQVRNHEGVISESPERIALQGPTVVTYPVPLSTTLRSAAMVKVAVNLSQILPNGSDRLVERVTTQKPITVP